MIAQALRRHAAPMACIAGIVLVLNLQLVMHLGTHFIGRPFDDAAPVI
jgi:hypothetical protein